MITGPGLYKNRKGLHVKIIGPYSSSHYDWAGNNGFGYKTNGSFAGNGMLGDSEDIVEALGGAIPTNKMLLIIGKKQHAV